jgi:hypothetical protein
MVVGVEQHFVGLQQIGAQREGAAVGQLGVGDLQLGPLAAKDRPVFRPVELERLAGLKCQGNKGAASVGLLFSMSGGLPLTRKGGHAIV